ESGTGKEVIARAIHELSARAAEPFLAVNCAAMSESLMESELFGHERGSFTGADRLRQGRFELAHNGTLLLDEVSEVRPHIQAKLLRVLQERAFERVGSSTTISIDVRVIATTNRDLPNEAARGEFRQDLFYRLNVLPISLPPLRERSQDVPLLAPHFVRTICAREGKPAKRLSDAALDLLTAYAWPGNVRELQNLCERAVVLCQKDEIPADLIRGWLGLAMPMTRPATPTAANGSALSPVFPGGGVAATDTSPLRWVREPRQLSDIEREVIVETLKRFDGHRLKTAKALGIGVRTLGLKLKKWKEQHLVADHL
ncbi:MAG TPA: sigma-54-dependent Fis family transcriptional regulator, partial [Phycisphaerales bacterium]|nr:sigma-54-dependent Fis family transcriptional regulator [Phycisphaerales bacterium]